MAVVVPALLLSACSQPVFVPEAGPNAPGFAYKPPPPPPPPPPRVAVTVGPIDRAQPDGGAVDSVVRRDGSFDVIGWALLAREAPRGVLRLVLPEGVDAEVRTVVNVRRPDVVDATSSKANTWAGFTITVDGSLPDDADVCVVSRSSQGTFRLGGSDEQLCPT